MVTVHSKTIAGARMVKMLNFLKSLWSELDSVIELFIYLAIAFAMTKVFGITFLQGVSIVFIYFVLNLLRILIETFRNK